MKEYVHFAYVRDWDDPSKTTVYVMERNAFERWKAGYPNGWICGEEATTILQDGQEPWQEGR